MVHVSVWEALVYMNDHLGLGVWKPEYQLPGHQRRGSILALLLALEAKNRILTKSLFSVTLGEWLNCTGSLFPHRERNLSLFRESTLQDSTSDPFNLQRNMSIHRESREGGRRKGLKTHMLKECYRPMQSFPWNELSRAKIFERTMPVGPGQQPIPTEETGGQRYTYTLPPHTLTHTLQYSMCLLLKCFHVE